MIKCDQSAQNQSQSHKIQLQDIGQKLDERHFGQLIQIIIRMYLFYTKNKKFE